jgi:hypothetical protein
MERMAESLDLGEFLNDQGKYQQERYFSWCASKNLTPTAMGLGQWLMRAIGFKRGERNAGAGPAGVPIAAGDSSPNGGDGLAPLAAYPKITRWFDPARAPLKPSFVKHMIQVTVPPSYLRAALESGQLSPEATRVVEEVLGHGR